MYRPRCFGEVVYGSSTMKGIHSIIRMQAQAIVFLTYRRSSEEATQAGTIQLDSLHEDYI